MKRYLWQDRHGRWRVRKDGKTYPLRDEVGVWHEVDTPEGDRLYWEILRGKRAEPKRSWGAAFKLLMETEWDELAPRYRQDLAPVIAYLTEKIGGRHVAQLKPSDIYAAMDANKHRVRFANYLPVAISKAANLAIKRGWLTVNPALRIERLKTPKAKERPHTPWTDAAVGKFRAEAGPLPRLIFELGIGSVQRPGDLVGFTWGDYDDEISSYSGHATIAMVRKYAGEARQIMLAKSAKKKRDGG